MAREADFDVDLFVERIRSGQRESTNGTFTLAEDDEAENSPQTKAPKVDKNLKH